MGGARRLDEGESKLNFKKVGVFILAIFVLAMIVISLQKILENTDNKPKGTNSNIEYFSLYTNKKWGVIDSNGNIVIEPTYDEMIVVPNNEKAVFLCVYDVNQEDKTFKTKVLNEKNKEILTGYSKVELLDNYDEYNNIWYEKNILKVQKNNKYGIINYEGKWMLSAEYDNIETLKNSRDSIIIEKDGKVGVCNGLGEIIVHPEYSNILPLGQNAKNGYIVVDENNKYGIVGLNKRVTVTPQYTNIKEESSTDTYIVKDGGWKLINNKNEDVLTGDFDDIVAINGSNAVVVKDNKYGVMNIDGTLKIPYSYSNLKYAFGNYYIAKESDKYGLIDTANKTKIDFKYVGMFYRNNVEILEAVKSDYTEDIYDNGLNKKVTGIVSEVNVEDGYMKIREGEEYKYYNFKFEPKENTEVLVGKTLYLSKKDGKYGYIDKNGNVIVEYIYDDATEQNAFGYSAVNKGGLWGSIDKTGKEIATPQHKLNDYLIIDFIGKWHLGMDLNLNYYTGQ